LWTKTLRCYRSPNDLLIDLKQAGLSDGRVDGAFSAQHFSLFHLTVTGPLANAIMEEGQKEKMRRLRIIKPPSPSAYTIAVP